MATTWPSAYGAKPAARMRAAATAPARIGRTANQKPPAGQPMPFRRRHFLALVTLGAYGPAHAARIRVGEVSTVTGTAVALFSGEPARPLTPESPVLIDDLLVTEPTARLACRLEGGVELRLGGGATLRVDAGVLRGPRAGVALRSFGAGGPLLVDRPPDPTPLPIVLVLPWARIGVRGTRFFAGPLDDRAVVFVARGQVAVEAAGATAILGEGEGVDIAVAGAPPGPVTRWGAARIARALALVE